MTCEQWADTAKAFKEQSNTLEQTDLLVAWWWTELFENINSDIQYVSDVCLNWTWKNFILLKLEQE